MENDKIISNTNSNSNIIKEFEKQTKEIAEEMNKSENSDSIDTQESSPDFTLSELELKSKVKSSNF